MTIIYLATKYPDVTLVKMSKQKTGHRKSLRCRSRAGYPGRFSWPKYWHLQVHTNSYTARFLLLRSVAMSGSTAFAGSWSSLPTPLTSWV